LNNIRVTYSGLISLGVTILGVVTGTVFVVMVTRRLSPEDFGLWTFIGSMISYISIAESVVAYWTTRQIARGEKVGKTAVLTSMLFSTVGLIVYVIVMISLSNALKINSSAIMLASALIPLAFLSSILNSICLGFKPQAVSYGTISFEISKIPLGFLFVVLTSLGINGALLSTIGASIIKVVILAAMAKEQLKGILNRQAIKYWIKMSWLTLYMSSFGTIYRFDVIVFSLIVNSLVGVAYWGAASTIGNLVSYSSVSQGLYSKLLSTGKKEYAEDNMKKTMYFALPALGASIIFARPILHILNPAYDIGSIIVIFLSLSSLVQILMGLSFGILESYEKIDVDKQANFRKYFRSNLFLTPTLRFILSCLYIPILAVSLLFLKNEHASLLDMVTMWSIISFAIHIPFMAYGLILINRKYSIGFPFKDVLKFGGVTLLASLIVFLVSSQTLKYSTSVFDFLPKFIPLFALGAGIYFGFTYAIDKSTRNMFKGIIKELKNV
jgi:hypothetical protein